MTGESTFYAAAAGYLDVRLKQNGVTKRFTYWENGDQDGLYDVAQTTSVVVPVTAGAHTFALTVDEVAASFGDAWKSQITVEYFPQGAATATDTTSGRPNR